MNELEGRMSPGREWPAGSARWFVLSWDDAEVTTGRILRGPWARRAMLLLVVVLCCYLAFAAYVMWGLYATRDW